MTQIRRPNRPSAAPPPPAPPAAVMEAVVAWEAIREAFVQGEDTGGTDASAGTPLRRWPSLRDLAARFNVDFDVLAARAKNDGWEARKGAFVASLDRERQRAIIDRIAAQDVNSRLAYLGIHNDLLRGIGRIVQTGIPAEKPANGSGCSFLPRDLKTIADTTLACAEIMGAAQGRMKGTESPLTLAVQIAQAHSLSVPVPGLSPAQQAAIVQVGAPTEPVRDASLWSILIEARRGPAPVVDPYDAPTPLPPTMGLLR